MSSACLPFFRTAIGCVLLCLASCSMPKLGQPFHQETVRMAVDTELDVVQISVQPISGQPADSKNEVPVTPVNAPAPALWDAGTSPADLPTDLHWAAAQEAEPSRAEVAVDFGVGQVPYDDGTKEYRLDYRPVRGFSDALVQLELRSHLEPGVSVHGIVALNRVLDETLMEALNEGDWAWIGVGLQFSW